MDKPTGMTTGVHTSRRRTLASVVSLIGIAGCGGSGGTSLQFDEVNVLNYTDRELSGAIFIADPNGTLVFERGFDVPAREENNPSSGLIRYGDVFTTTGTYDVSVTLETSVEGLRDGQGTVTVADTEETSLVVALGAPKLDAAIAVSTAAALPEVTASND